MFFDGNLTLLQLDSPHEIRTGTAEELAELLPPYRWGEGYPWRPVFAVFDQVRLLRGGEHRFWWSVVAVDWNFTILVRQKPFSEKGTYLYTIIDWMHGVRGPCNLIGQGWDFKSETLFEDGKELLRALNYELEMKVLFQSLPVGEFIESNEVGVEVSYRNRVDITFEDYICNDRIGVDLLADQYRNELVLVDKTTAVAS